MTNDRPDSRSESPGRRGNDYCAHHEANTLAIGKHSGQWKMLFAILGIGIGLISTIAGSAYKTQQETMEAIKSSVTSIDKVITAYIASHTTESAEGFRRISKLEEELEELDDRVNRLEKTP